MNNKFHKGFLVFSLFILLSFSHFNFETFSATTQDKYDNNNEYLEQLKRQQENINKEISDINTNIGVTGAKISKINSDIVNKQNEINKLQEKIDVLNSNIEYQYETMKLRIQYMYERNTSKTIDFLISSDSFSEFLSRSEYMGQISNYDRSMLDKLNNTIQEQHECMQNLDIEFDQLVALKESSNQTLSELNTLLSSAKSQYSSNAEDIEKSEALALEYEKQLEEERIARELAAIEELKNQHNTPLTLSQVSPFNYTETDLAMLAAIIECEAANQPYEGLIAVGSVVMNRVVNPRFDNSLTAVIYSPYQFSPVGSGRFSIVLARGANERCVNAAKDVLNGKIYKDLHYFHVYNSNKDKGGYVIGDHVFY